MYLTLQKTLESMKSAVSEVHRQLINDLTLSAVELKYMCGCLIAGHFHQSKEANLDI